MDRREMASRMGLQCQKLTKHIGDSKVYCVGPTFVIKFFPNLKIGFQAPVFAFEYFVLPILGSTIKIVVDPIVTY